MYIHYEPKETVLLDVYDGKERYSSAQAHSSTKPHLPFLQTICLRGAANQTKSGFKGQQTDGLFQTRNWLIAHMMAHKKVKNIQIAFAP